MQNIKKNMQNIKKKAKYKKNMLNIEKMVYQDTS